MIIVWWIKRDLRLADNPALTAAVSQAAEERRPLLPVWVDEPAWRRAPDTGALHEHMLASALRSLRLSLRRRQSDLVVLHGDLPGAFAELHRKHRVAAIHVEEETGLGWSFARDRALRRWCREQSIILHEHPRNAVVRGLEDRNKRMRIWRERMQQAPLPLPAVPALSSGLRTLVVDENLPAELPRFRTAVQRCDEHAAWRTLSSFLETRSAQYRSSISSPSLARFGGSRLSVHLAWGTLSIRQVVHALAAEREAASREERRIDRRSLSAFESRLFWHDHFIQRLEDEPQAEHEPLNRAYRGLNFERDCARQRLEALLAGQTGFPMVDATARALARTGFVNFRMRAMFVSAAVHLLHLDWRDLLYPMARIMADYLPGIHLSQLQMQAGVVGINTVRVYNPAKQLIDNDPDCRFVKRFLPELRECSAEQIRAWTLAHSGSATSRSAERRQNDQMDLFSTAAELGALGDYPAPIVDYRSASAEMKRRIFTIRRSAAAREEAERVLARHGSRKRGGNRRR